MSDTPTGDGDSSGWLGRLIRRLLGGADTDQSLRAQLEEAIDEHEEDGPAEGNGDLSPLERQMLDRKSTRLNSSHLRLSRMPSSA